MLRENTLACPSILKSATEHVLKFPGRGPEPDVVIVTEIVRALISNEEQLDMALEQVRDRCLKSILDGTPVILG